MQITTKTAKFKFSRDKCAPRINIYFGRDEVFCSCQQGADLFDFDALLAYFVPNIDFDQITFSIARHWEQKLYHMLVQGKEPVATRKVLADFFGKIEKAHSKKTASTLIDPMVRNFIQQVTDSALQRIWTAGERKRAMSASALPFPEYRMF